MLRERVKIMASNLPNSFWEWLVLQSSFRSSILTQGYYELEKEEVSKAVAEWYENRKNDYGNLYHRYKFSRYPAARKSLLAFQSASFDFYSQTPEPLRRLRLFAIRTGKGNCVIFNSHVFPLPYGGPVLCSRYFTREFSTRIPRGYRNLVNSLPIQVNEQSFIKTLHFSGVFTELVRYICGAKEYEIGPSGQLSSSFPFWMMKGFSRKNNRRLERFMFEGTNDLDECLFPRSTDVIVPIEAKIDDGVHFDLGWHKLAFPCYRFIDNSRPRPFLRDVAGGRRISGPSGTNKMKIIPVYCLFVPWGKRTYIYVFPTIEIHKERYGYRNYDVEYGLVLNDVKQFTPRIVLSVEMNKCF
jgi:hypothetical protein